MNKKRCGGVLMHISSLPGKYGTGTMGKEAKAFADSLREMGFTLWQTLPLNPTDMSGSPYCSNSAFAGNISLIDPYLLYESGLITADELKENEYGGSKYIANYSFACEKRLLTLKRAFSRLDGDTRTLVDIFASQNEWVLPYAYFMALKDFFDLKPWWEWPEEYIRYEDALKLKDRHKSEIDFYIFTQYIFYTQFRALKEYANSIGIELMGDMPIYVSRDSADLWSDREEFQINEKSLAPSFVAGVPPDYFSADGQLWGNPLYDWDKMEKNGF